MKPRTVLVVDDNPLNLELAGDVLEAAGFAVVKANMAAEGIAIARELSPDVILMDIDMPGMNGYDAVRALKDDTRTRHIPTVALTAFAMERDEQRALLAGFDSFISKPIRTRTFADVIGRIVDGTR